MRTVEGKYCDNIKIFTDNVESSAMTLIQSIADSAAFKDSKIRIMPDVHAGKGIVIGFTAPIDKFIAPSHVGVDIGCTVDSWFTDVPVGAIDKERLERDIRRAVKFGMEYQDRTQISCSDFCELMNHQLRAWRLAWPEQIRDIQVDAEYITNFCKTIGMDEKVFWKSLGTVGSGNHFVEIGEDGQTHNAVFTIHCGSRNLGVKVANMYEKIASAPYKGKGFKAEQRAGMKAIIAEYKSAHRAPEIPDALKAFKEEQRMKFISGYLTGVEMSNYLTDMAFATAYSLCNHDIIAGLILQCIQKQVSSATVTETVRSIHNYVDFTDHIIRKGAIRAYEGERCVIPFNMRDGLAICTGKSNSDWNKSAPHGAGRVMSRSAAKKNLSVKNFQKQMEGIVSTSVGRGTIDEAPDAYKSKDEILDLIKYTVDIVKFVTPIINLKDKNTVSHE